MELPLVSFVIPTYNEEPMIERCLKSIMAQDYPPDRVEVLVVDDGSTDGTLGICYRYPVTILHNPTGIAEMGYRLGITAAHGPLVVLASADNELASRGWLRQMVRPMLEDEEIACCHPQLLSPRDDVSINRYFALLQTSPLAYYLMWRLRRPVLCMRHR